MDKKMVKPVIITGQQIGLLGGPLYTVYKVLGAVKQAVELGGEAVYWLETNDADFNEINHVDFINSSNELQRIVWEKDTAGFSTGLIEIDEELINLLNSYFDSLPQTEFTPELRKSVMSCYQMGRTLGEASETLAQYLFGRLPVTLFNPMEKSFREFTQPILTNEAANTESGSQCNLFCMSQNKRLAVFKKENGYYLRDGKKVNLSDYELLPNVKTRNICQDAYFNTHTYIAGPGEIKYISELDPIYRFHNVTKSRVKPRMSILLIEPKQKRLMKKLNFEIADIETKPKEVLNHQVVKNFGSFDWNEVKANSQEALKRFLRELEKNDLPVDELQRVINDKLKNLIGMKRKEQKEGLNDLLSKVDFLSHTIQPYGNKQERVFNIFQYMNKYGGLKFIDYLFDNHDFERKILEVNNG